MNKIILSIIVPVYNVEKYLSKCLESIINNYNEKIEVILVNDGSKDNSGLICDKYVNNYEYISVIHKNNGGLSSARNCGINSAKGKYIWFVDSDDYIKERSIDKIIEYSKEDSDVIISSYCEVYSNGKIINDNIEKDKNNLKAYEFFKSKGNISYAAYRFICKRKFLLENNIFFVEGIYHEDEEWSPRVLYKAKIFSVIPGTIYCYKADNEGSIMNTPNPKKIYDKIYIIDIMNKRVNEEIKEDSGKEFFQFRMEHNLISALNELILYDEVEKEKLIQLIKEKINILKNINNKKSRLVYITIKLFGINNASRLLYLRNKINNKL